MKGSIKLALVAMTAVLAACGDSTVAPRAKTADATIPGGGATASLTGWDTLRFSFTIDPYHNTTYWLGLGNSIVFPAGSLCDPATSTYGPDQWDAPCPLATRTLLVNAKAWLDKSGHPRIDFDQHIRFAPSADPSKWVVLTFTDFLGALTRSNIVYCASPTSPCVNEALADPSVATVRNPVTGQLTRRIKHFSGYNVFSGRCDSSDGTCTSDGTDAMSSSMSRHGGSHKLSEATPDSTGGAGRQGYMLAWGRSEQEQ
jgi:hypothetical protein